MIYCNVNFLPWYQQSIQENNRFFFAQQKRIDAFSIDCFMCWWVVTRNFMLYLSFILSLLQGTPWLYSLILSGSTLKTILTDQRKLVLLCQLNIAEESEKKLSHMFGTDHDMLVSFLALYINLPSSIICTLWYVDYFTDMR